MIVLVLLIISAVFFVVFLKTNDNLNLLVVQLISLVLCCAAGVGSLCLFFQHLSVTIPPLKEAKRMCYEETYKTLTYAINNDIDNIITLSKNIAEYNAEILSGRIMMDNFITSYITYDFYYDLDLITLDNDDKK